MLNKTIGENFKRYRKAAGLKQSEIAEIINVSNDTITRLERGKSIPGIETLIDISKTLNVPLDYFITGESRENLIFSSVVFVERIKELSDGELTEINEILKLMFEHFNLRGTPLKAIEEKAQD